MAGRRAFSQDFQTSLCGPVDPSQGSMASSRTRLYRRQKKRPFKKKDTGGGVILGRLRIFGDSTERISEARCHRNETFGPPTFSLARKEAWRVEYHYCVMRNRVKSIMPQLQFPIVGRMTSAMGGGKRKANNHSALLRWARVARVAQASLIVPITHRCPACKAHMHHKFVRVKAAGLSRPIHRSTNPSPAAEAFSDTDLCCDALGAIRTFVICRFVDVQPSH